MGSAKPRLSGPTAVMVTCMVRPKICCRRAATSFGHLASTGSHHHRPGRHPRRTPFQALYTTCHLFFPSLAATPAEVTIVLEAGPENVDARCRHASALD